MRIAVALPSLEAGAPLRRAVDAMLAGIAATGTDIEGFAEHDRLNQGDAFPVRHYLRLPERQTTHPFDLALYPLGRDATPYQGVFGLMRAFPSVVWLLDPGIHHLAVGGIAFLDKWADYRDLLDRAYGHEEGSAIAQTVASHWGTGALYRRYDLVAVAAASQPGVLAAWSSLAEHVSGRLEGRHVGVAPLGMVGSPTVLGPSADLGQLDVAIMTVNESHTRTALEAAAAALEIEPTARVSVCMSEPIYRAAGLEAAQRLGIDERVQWELTTSPKRLSQVASSSGLLLWLAEELQGGHRTLLLEGLAAGKLTMVPDTPLYEDLPRGAVVKLDLGRHLGPTLEETLRALCAEPALGAGLSQNGRAFADGCPGIDAAAALLVAELEQLVGTCAPRLVDVAGPTRAGLSVGMSAAAVPGGADQQTRHLIERLLDEHAATAKPSEGSNG